MSVQERRTCGDTDQRIPKRRLELWILSVVLGMSEGSVGDGNNSNSQLSQETGG